MEVAEPDASVPAAPPFAGRGVVTAGVVIMSFLAALDSTVVSTAMPTIVGDLGGMSCYAWVFTAYMLPMTVAGPLWGKLSDLFGQRPVYLGCVAAFFAGSLAAGAATGMGVLILARVVQGIGAGGIVPLGQAVLAALYDREDRARLQTWITLVYGFASAFGPSIGGVFAQQLSWRWAFLINIPLASVAAVLLWRTMPAAQPRTDRPVLDIKGAVLFSVALTLALFLMNEVSRWGTYVVPVVVAWGLVLVLLGSFIRVELHHREPLLPPALFSNRTFLATIVCLGLGGMLLFGAIAYLPLLCQGVLKMDAIRSGQVVTPLMICWMTLSAFTARLALRVGNRACAFLGGLCYVGAFAVLWLAREAPVSWVAAAGGMVGLGAGFTMIPLLLATQAAVATNVLGTATAGLLLFRTLGSTIGIALMGAAVSAAGGGLSADDLLKLPAGLVLLERGLHDAFGIAFAVAILALLASWLVPPGVAGRAATEPHPHLHLH